MNGNAAFILAPGDNSGGGGGTSSYSDLSHKPQINSVELSGDKSSADLGLANINDTTPSDTSVYSSNKVDTLLDALEDEIADKADSDDIPDVIDSLTSTSTTDALSANQGRVLNEGKADKSTTYTKTEADALLDDKVDKSLFNTITRREDLNVLSAGESTVIVQGVTANAPCSYGYCICFCANSSWLFQIAFSNYANMSIYIRTKINSDTWNDWRMLTPTETI